MKVSVLCAEKINKLFQSSDFLSNIFNRIMDPLVLVTGDGAIGECNQCFEALLVEREELERIVNSTGMLNQFREGVSVIEAMVNNREGREVCLEFYPLWKGSRCTGALGVARLDCISSIYQLMHRFKESKDGYSVEIKFKPKRHLPGPMQSLIGNNVEFVKMLHKAAAASKTDSSVLIFGESGAGKQMVAEAIHRASSRAKEAFVEVNCAAIPESLMESEFFGYDPGAFTSALEKGKTGKFEAAHRGTIFFDEIGELSLNMQSKLLRALQFNEFEKVGGTTVHVDTRFIAATNRDLEEMVSKGEFREDLYYRLNVIPVVVDPLRKRKDDLDVLLDYFITGLQKKYGEKDMNPGADIITLFYHYQWPGNIRELENVLEYGFITADFEGSREIRVNHLPDYLSHYAEEKDFYQGDTKVVLPDPEEVSLSEWKESVEREYIYKVLYECGFNKTEAMRRLQVSRGTFYNRLKKFGWQEE